MPSRILLLACDERGGEVLEWALIAALILVATFAVGPDDARVLARWAPQLQ